MGEANEFDFFPRMTHDGTKDLRLAVRMWRKANTTSFPLLDASFGSGLLVISSSNKNKRSHKTD